jgi:hypothetical protein
MKLELAPCSLLHAPPLFFMCRKPLHLPGRSSGSPGRACNPVKSPVFSGNLNLGEWSAKWGQDEHSVVADPLFVDADNSDFRLNPNSPALQAGFQPLDIMKTGRQVPPVLNTALASVPPGFS